MEKKEEKKNWEKSKVTQVQPKKTTRDRDEIGPTVNGWVLTAGAREHLVISTPFSISPVGLAHAAADLSCCCCCCSLKYMVRKKGVQRST